MPGPYGPAWHHVVVNHPSLPLPNTKLGASFRTSWLTFPHVRFPYPYLHSVLRPHQTNISLPSFAFIVRILRELCERTSLQDVLTLPARPNVERLTSDGV